MFWNVRTYPAKILMILYYIFDVFFQFPLVIPRRRAQIVTALFLYFLEKGLFLYIQVWFFVRKFNSHLYYLQVVLCKIKIIKLFVELLFWGMISDGTEMFLFVWLILQELRSYGHFCSGVRNISWMSAGGSVLPAKYCLVQCMSFVLLVRIFLMQPWGVSGKVCSVPGDGETEPQLLKWK